MLTVLQAAQRAGRHPETIRRWIRAGLLKSGRSTSRLALHQIAWRGGLPVEQVASAHARLNASPMAVRAPARLGQRAWEIADRYGWAKTYDAEYLALAELLDCRLVTLQRRLRDRVSDPARVIGPTELP